MSKEYIVKVTITNLEDNTIEKRFDGRANYSTSNEKDEDLKRFAYKRKGNALKSFVMEDGLFKYLDAEKVSDYHYIWGKKWDYVYEVIEVERRAE